MKEEMSENQRQTQKSFGFKWKKRDTYESEAVQQEWKRWLFEKYFDGDATRLDRMLHEDGGRKKILDAGCGSGGSGILLFGDHLKQHDYFGIDLSDAVRVAEDRFQEKEIPAHFEQCDLNSIPVQYGDFDIIFSEGVLHHTDSVEQAIAHLSKRLKKGGKFLFYVYIKKAPIREFTDDLIRDALVPMSDDVAWNALKSLTKLGKTLGDLDLEIDIDEDIPFLGILKGRYNLQRLFYYKICKAFYRPDYTLDEMNHINFDWFRPINCFRHAPEEISDFCMKADLKIERLHIEESGITVIAAKI